MHVLRILAALTAVPVALALPSPAFADARGLAVGNKSWTGDFDKMLERRMIRVYAPYSRSLYFNDKGRERGLTADLVRDFAPGPRKPADGRPRLGGGPGGRFSARNSGHFSPGQSRTA